MSNTIEVNRDGAAVRITVYVCGKVARLRVTPENARRLASSLVAASVDAGHGDDAGVAETWLERLQRLDGR